MGLGEQFEGSTSPPRPLPIVDEIETHMESAMQVYNPKTQTPSPDRISNLPEAWSGTRIGLVENQRPTARGILPRLGDWLREQGYEVDKFEIPSGSDYDSVLEAVKSHDKVILGVGD